MNNRNVYITITQSVRRMNSRSYKNPRKRKHTHTCGFVRSQSQSDLNSCLVFIRMWRLKLNLIHPYFQLYNVNSYGAKVHLYEYRHLECLYEILLIIFNYYFEFDCILFHSPCKIGRKCCLLLILFLSWWHGYNKNS